MHDSGRMAGKLVAGKHITSFDTPSHSRNTVDRYVSRRVATGRMKVEDIRDCTEMFFRMDKAKLRQGILDCNQSSCDCAADTKEVGK